MLFLIIQLIQDLEIEDKKSSSDNAFTYQSLKNLLDAKEYYISVSVECSEPCEARISGFYYKNNQYVKHVYKSVNVEKGIHDIYYLFTTDNSIADEYRIAFGINKSKEYAVNLIGKNNFNPNNLSGDNGEPTGWRLTLPKSEYSDIEIDSFKTVKSISDGTTTIP